MTKENMATADNAAHSQRISVPFSYPVHFTRGVFDADNPLLAKVLDRAADTAPKTLVYLDSGLVEAHPHLPDSVVEYANRHRGVIRTAQPPRTLPGGETAKDGWGTALEVVEDIGKLQLCRHSFVVAAGGGALLDAVGFAAALVHRGVRLVRLPSTTLSQDDSGVGVKNGINQGEVKNFIGTFAPPFAVINDFSFLRTLPHDVMLDGIAEAFKVAIVKDAAFFDFLCDSAERIARAEPAAIEEAVRRSALLHLDHIRAGNDPFEFGVSRPLDFGHWSAHRLEGLSKYSVRHGQAVAVGIALDTYYSWRNGLISRDEMTRILDAFNRTGLPLYHTLLSRRDKDKRLLILEGLAQFREHLGGRLSITLPRGIGSRIEVHEMDTAVIEEGIGFLADNWGS